MCDSTGIQTVDLLESLQTNEEMRLTVAAADIITIWIGVNDLSLPQNLYLNGYCGGEDNPDCIRERIAESNDTTLFGD